MSITLAEHLRQTRLEYGLSLKDVSAGTDLSVSYLSDLERGRTNPSLGTLQRLADYYEFPLYMWFLDDNDNPIRVENGE